MGLWPFFLKRTVTTTGIIQVPHEDALNIIKDPPTLIKLNPLVSTYECRPDDPATYIITDTIKMLFFTSRTTYSAKAEIGEDRTTFHVVAGAGVKSTNHWTARRQDGRPDAVEIEEESHIEAPFFFIPFVVTNVRKSHRELMDRLTHKLESKHKHSRH